MTMIEIALPADGEQILALAQHIAGFNALDQECIEELWGAYAAQGPKASGYDFLVARPGEFAEAEYTDEQDRRPVGPIVGFACYGPTPLTVGVYDLYWLAVDPDARQAGGGPGADGSSGEACARERRADDPHRDRLRRRVPGCPEVLRVLRLSLPGRDPRLLRRRGRILLIFGKRLGAE